MPDSTIAVIIPAFNEGQHIQPTIEAVHAALQGHQYEIVVVDNGSHDETGVLATAAGATVLVDSNCTVGGLRNLGAANVSADVLLFLDADVHLTPEWRATFPNTIAELMGNRTMVSGSTCDIPADATWLERNWFGPIASRHKSYINSGHLIIGATFFRELGGFDEKLRTGEDYDLCARAQRSRGTISPNPSLVVHHHGFPRTLRAFVAREAWHGIADFRSLRSILNSKIALAALLFGTLQISILIALVIKSTDLLLPSLIATALLCLILARHMIGGTSLRKLAAGTVVAYAYLLGRVMAGINSIRSRADQRRQRNG